MRHRVGLFMVVAGLAAFGCGRSPAGVDPADSGALGLAADPDLPWLELTSLRFRGIDESGQTAYELTLEGIAARYWPHPDFVPGPNWEPRTQWLQFIHVPGNASEGDPNVIDGGGRIQQTPNGPFGLGKIEVRVSGVYTTPNGTERITGTLIFDLAEGLVVPIKGESFFEPCGILCVDFGLQALFAPDPIFNLPPDIGLFGEVIGRLSRPLAAISAGGSHTCGLFETGTAYCWGENDFGQLGDGSTNDSPRPAPVAGGLSFERISAGGTHTCGLTAAGQAYCWGFNNFGQLGDGTNTQRDHPVMVGGGHLFTAIDAGWDHTCGLTAAGDAYCWGGNEFGPLGDGTNDDRNTPVSVVFGLTFRAIAAGAYHTCALDSTGEAYCWGRNQFGQLGFGPGWDAEVHHTGPGRVVGGRTFTKIAAGGDHTCAVTTGRDAYCWGLGDLGQLGNGFTADQGTPTLVVGGHTFTDISAGTDHTCAAASAGPYCWGNNFFGQLGEGSNVNRSTPVIVGGGHDLTVLSAGGQHSCGLTTGGRPYCWGRNMEGQLGDGTHTDSDVPVWVVFF